MKYNDLRLTRNEINNIKYLVSPSLRALLQDDLNMIEQEMQRIRPDEEMVRLSPADEQLNGYAILPPEERIPKTVKKWKLIFAK